MKYGIRVPSGDVASCCSTTSFAASNLAGGAFTTLSEPDSTSACHSVVGARKLVTLRNARSSRKLESATRIDAFSGKSRCRTDQPPSAVGV